MKRKITYVLLFLLPVALFAQQGPPPNFFQKGMQHYNAGEYDAAIQAFMKVVNAKQPPGPAAQKNAPANHPKKAEAHYYIAMSMIKKAGDGTAVPDQAMTNLNTSIELKPNFPPARLARGKILVQRKQIEPAIADLNIAVQAMPGNEEAHFQLGLAYGWAANYPKAAEHFKHVVQMNQNSIYGQYYLGQAYSKMGERSLAEEHWRLFLKLCPSCPEAPVVNNFLSGR
jgi:tetratricopeptide (TPR) repeat protein